MKSLPVSKIVAFFAFLGVATGPTSAADTLVGPRNVPCEKAMSNTTDMMLSVMWVAGFASSANRMGKPDWLQGVTINDIVDSVGKACDADRTKTMEQVAIEVVGRLRMEHLVREKAK